MACWNLYRRVRKIETDYADAGEVVRAYEQKIKELEALVARARTIKTDEAAAQVYADAAASLRARYADHGNWSRHYSTVRLGGTTFLLGIAVAVLRFKDDTEGVVAAVTVGILLLAAGVLFFRFTYLMEKRWQDEREDFDRLRNLLKGELDVGACLAKREGSTPWIKRNLWTIGLYLLLAAAIVLATVNSTGMLTSCSSGSGAGDNSGAEDGG